MASMEQKIAEFFEPEEHILWPPLREVHVSAEDEDFFVNYNTTTPPTTEDTQRFKALEQKLRVLVKDVACNLHAANVVFGAPAVGTCIFPLNKLGAQLRRSEMIVRKALEQAGLLLRLGIGDSLHELTDETWSTLALLITYQQEAHRQLEAQKIYLVQLSKSLVDPKRGPYHRSSISLMKNLGWSLKLQGQPILAARTLSLARTLLKYGLLKGIAGTDIQSHMEEAGTQPPLLETLGARIIDCYDESHSYVMAIPLLVEQIQLLEAPRKRTPIHDNVQELVFSLWTLGRYLMLDTQPKFQEAEVVLEKALAVAANLQAVKTVEQLQEELKGLSIKSLLESMRKVGMLIPPGAQDKGELVRLLAIHTFKQGLIGKGLHLVLFASFAKSLAGQKDKCPENLTRAEALLRPVYEAMLLSPAFGPNHPSTLTTMDYLHEALTGLHKYEEALALGKRALAIRTRVFGDSQRLAIKRNLDMQQQALVQQSAFRKAAEEYLGPRSEWTGSEDGHPASVMFQRTLEDAQKKRSSSSSSSSRAAASETDLASMMNDLKISTLAGPGVAYNPADEKDVNYAAMLAGLGVIGVSHNRTKRVKEGPDAGKLQFDMIWFGPDTVEAGLTQSTPARIWEKFVSLMLINLPLPGGYKTDAVQGAMSNSDRLMREAQDAEQLARGSKEVQQQREEEEGGGRATGSAEQQAASLVRKKPTRICIACGSYAAKKKCSRCNQAYACNDECFLAAWRAFHKLVCTPVNK